LNKPFFAARQAATANTFPLNSAVDTQVTKEETVICHFHLATH